MLKNVCLPQHPRIIDMFNEDTHELFALSDLLISDFSSIVFDYSILNKTMYFYIKDLNDYIKCAVCVKEYSKLKDKRCIKYIKTQKMKERFKTVINNVHDGLIAIN